LYKSRSNIYAGSICQKLGVEPFSSYYTTYFLLEYSITMIDILILELLVFAIVLRIVWRMYIDHLTLQFSDKWDGLEYPYYSFIYRRDLIKIKNTYRKENPVIYYPFVYRGRRVCMETSDYPRYIWGNISTNIRLKEQYIILN
jgi:hypothetical protein